MKYFFVLGNAADLAREEVRAVLPHQELLYDPPVLILETENEIPFDRFGGVIKVGKITDQDIVEYLKNSGQKKIDFGISDYSKDSIASLQNDVVNLSKKIKKELVEAGIKTRFVLPIHGEMTLSSVVVRKQLLTELLLFEDMAARTIWSQDFEDWGKRDYGRPQVAAHIGMLPPKVARMMINVSHGKTILDPFCGVGTIISEALILELNAIGSDLNPSQVDKTRKNLEWLGKTTALFVGDARKISQKLPAQSIDAIVTEPDLGSTNSIKGQELSIKQKLERLYIDSLIDWKKILKPGGRVVIVLPSFGENSGLVKNVIDKAAAIGYTLTAGPFPYFRPQAKVRRNICVFASR